MPDNSILGTVGVDNDAGPEGTPAPDAGTGHEDSSAVSEGRSNRTGAPAGDKGKDNDSEPMVPMSRYQEAERKITELGQANAEFRGRMAALEELRAQQPQQQADPFAWLDDEKLTDQFEEDPTGTFKSTIEKVMRQFGELIGEQSSYYDRKINELRPEAIETRRAMSELAGQEWFEAIPKEQREGAAMAYLKLKAQTAGNGERPPSPPGGMGGGKSTGRAPKKEVPMAENPAYNAILTRMGGLKGGIEKATLIGK